MTNSDACFNLVYSRPFECKTRIDRSAIRGESMTHVTYSIYIALSSRIFIENENLLNVTERKVQQTGRIPENDMKNSFRTTNVPGKAARKVISY